MLHFAHLIISHPFQEKIPLIFTPGWQKKKTRNPILVVPAVENYGADSASR